eukprot:COSAG01_NODE_51179_length_356_cov_72.649805_1_plen_42_part_01
MIMSDGPALYPLVWFTLQTKTVLVVRCDTSNTSVTYRAGWLK